MTQAATLFSPHKINKPGASAEKPWRGICCSCCYNAETDKRNASANATAPTTAKDTPTRSKKTNSPTTASKILNKCRVQFCKYLVLSPDG
jgi:hypothetical protein